MSILLLMEVLDFRQYVWSLMFYWGHNVTWHLEFNFYLINIEVWLRQFLLLLV